MSSFVMRTIKINSFLDQSANLEYLSASVSIFIFHMQLSAEEQFGSFLRVFWLANMKKFTSFLLLNLPLNNRWILVQAHTWSSLSTWRLTRRIKYKKRFQI